MPRLACSRNSRPLWGRHASGAPKISISGREGPRWRLRGFSPRASPCATSKPESLPLGQVKSAVQGRSPLMRALREWVFGFGRHGFGLLWTACAAANHDKIQRTAACEHRFCSLARSPCEQLHQAACSLCEHPCLALLGSQNCKLQQQPALAVGRLVPTHAKIGMLSQLPASLGPSCLGCPKNLNFG